MRAVLLVSMAAVLPAAPSAGATQDGAREPDAKAHGRVERTLAELRSSPAPAPEAIERAYRVATEEAQALRLESAVAILELLHEKLLAAWSAADLALTLTRSGDYQGAVAVLESQLARTRRGEPDHALLLARLGLVTQGSGDVRRATALLGEAAAAGSTDAAVMLGRMHLLEGRSEAARASFRSVLARKGPAEAWALRGWGLTLIDRPRAAWTGAGP